jgi:hypothetical protein
MIFCGMIAGSQRHGRHHFHALLWPRRREVQLCAQDTPGIWERSQNDVLLPLGIIPFSSGPAIRPAHNLDLPNAKQQ